MYLRKQKFDGDLKKNTTCKRQTNITINKHDGPNYYCVPPEIDSCTTDFFDLFVT